MLQLLVIMIILCYYVIMIFCYYDNSSPNRFDYDSVIKNFISFLRPELFCSQSSKIKCILCIQYSIHNNSNVFQRVDALGVVDRVAGWREKETNMRS